MPETKRKASARKPARKNPIALSMLRVDATTAQALDALAAAEAREGFNMTRTDAHRVALLRGLRAIAADRDEAGVAVAKALGAKAGA